MGPLIIVSQSAPYDDCFENADKLIQRQYTKISAATDYADPSGNFTISVQDDKIVVEHTTPASGGSLLLLRQISQSTLSTNSSGLPQSEVEHAMGQGKSRNCCVKATRLCL